MEIRRTRAAADLVRSCALAHSVSTRAVRKWRESSDPRWRAFVAERAALASQPALGLAPASMTPADEEVAAAARFRALTALADEAVQRGDAACAERLLRAAEASHRILLACRSARTEHEATTGQLAAAEVQRVVDMTRAVARAVSDMPARCAAEANPQNPAVALAALRRWHREIFGAALREAGLTIQTPEVQE